MLLNDFRGSNELIIWQDLLLLLEGEPVKLAAPKNVLSEDIYIISDIPIFATSISMTEFCGHYNTADDMEDEMTKVRWRVFSFSHVFPMED